VYSKYRERMRDKVKQTRRPIEVHQWYHHWREVYDDVTKKVSIAFQCSQLTLSIRHSCVDAVVIIIQLFLSLMAENDLDSKYVRLDLQVGGRGGGGIESS